MSDAAARAADRPDREPLAPGLYLVPTPIGNLRDITLRALDVLEHCDAIACEDTREAQKLLNHFGLRTPTVSHHLHNERERAEDLVRRVQAGERIAVVSDAGMPGIADPGEIAVSLAIAAGVPVHALPGANAAVTALVASGFTGERFSYRGFLPSKGGERRSALEAVRAEMEAVAGAPTQIFYETPHRIVEALADVVAVFGPGHGVVLARELTKLHEEFLRGTAAEVLAMLEARERVRGEMVLLLNGSVTPLDSAEQESLAAAIRRAMRDEGVDEMTAVKRIARERGLSKSEAYREWQRTRGR
ncbi:16S rRNA (cytidine(1402)-2'-O)-methyltransferase [Terriglobus sp.]|uniref:16S rRNA (cytidine(1402)-2'-O)-methyltransferase n=1 Tax=Terriglobus sp. TaxID=1889013 RepID=UPI003AFF9D5A